MKKIALGLLCLAGIVAASGCSGGPGAGVLPSAAPSSQSVSGGSASAQDVFVPIEEGLRTRISTATVRQGTAPRSSPASR
jgi:hypothetical protein